MKNLYRILDANLNRTREGLRVIEDFVRFVAEDKKGSSLIKQSRAQLAKTIKSLPHPEKLILERDIRKDVSKFLDSATEMQRGGAKDLLLANLKRVQESLRSLEEFSKILSIKATKGFKRLRFRSYQIEKQLTQILIKSTKERQLDFNLYIISGPEAPFQQLKKAIQSGAKIVQYRDKEAPKKKYVMIARKLARYCKKRHVVFMVNDHPDICKVVEADGVHLGTEDMSIKKARQIVGEEKLIGLSVHSVKQALKAEKQGADYIGFWPIFKTPFKAGIHPTGLKALKEVLQKTRLPVVALGGINSENIKKVVQTFQSIKKQPRVAVIRAAKGAKAIKTLQSACT